MNVLQQYNLDISDAKLVTEQLSHRLGEAEQENIHDILEKQNEWQNIIIQMRSTREQLADIKKSINYYKDELMVCLCFEWLMLQML